MDVTKAKKKALEFEILLRRPPGRLHKEMRVLGIGAETNPSSWYFTDPMGYAILHGTDQAIRD